MTALSLKRDWSSIVLSAGLPCSWGKIPLPSQKRSKNTARFSFSSAFSLILTDRGGEFQNPDALEYGKDHRIRTSIYYCAPMCSWQKPHCEKNHEYIRKICPKGTSFDDYSQSDINRMMSHINSTPRQSLGGLSPMALAKLMLPQELLDCFGLTEIPADEIVLTSALLKKTDNKRKSADAGSI